MVKQRGDWDGNYDIESNYDVTRVAPNLTHGYVFPFCSARKENETIIFTSEPPTLLESRDLRGHRSSLLAIKMITLAGKRTFTPLFRIMSRKRDCFLGCESNLSPFWYWKAKKVNGTLWEQNKAHTHRDFSRIFYQNYLVKVSMTNRKLGK